MSLTKREKEVAIHLAMGHTVREVADLMDISHKTVDTHKTRLMKKMNVHNRVDLVRMAIKSGLIEYRDWLDYR